MVDSSSMPNDVSNVDSPAVPVLEGNKSNLVPSQLVVSGADVQAPFVIHDLGWAEWLCD